MLAIASGASLTASPVSAQRASRAEMARIEAQLSASDESEVAAAIEAVGALGRPRLVSALAARVRSGLPAYLLAAALDSAQLIGGDEAVGLFMEQCNHRREAVRIRVLEGLAAMSAGELGANCMLVRMADTAPAVRIAAVIAAEESKLAGAVDALLAALERGVDDASEALGVVVPPAGVAPLLVRLEGLSASSVGPGLQRLLTRKDLSTDLRLKVVEHVVQRGNTQSMAFFRRFMESEPTGLPARLRQAIEQAMQESQS